MDASAELSLSNLLNINKLDTRASINTQYVVMVVKVSEDGRFVSVVDCTLEWKADPNGDTFMLNSYNKSIRCSKIKPWVINDVPVEQPYVRGQWKINTRPRVGDYGILSVFYHDIDSWKQKGGFQAPSAIRIHALDSCSFRPGLPNHADVDAEQEAYPSDDEWEVKGNGVTVKFTAPNNEESEADKKIDITVGGITINIVAPAEGDPVMTINSSSININGNINITGDINATGNITTTGNVSTEGDVSVTGTVTADTDVVGGGVSLKSHVHPFPYNAGPTPTTGTTNIPTPGA